MKLDTDWRQILRRAWSVRLMLLAALLTGCEAIITVAGIDWVPLPVWARLVVVFIVIAAAFVSRLIAQKGLDR